MLVILKVLLSLIETYSKGLQYCFCRNLMSIHLNTFHQFLLMVRSCLYIFRRLVFPRKIASKIPIRAKRWRHSAHLHILYLAFNQTITIRSLFANSINYLINSIATMSHNCHFEIYFFSSLYDFFFLSEIW